MKPKITIGMAHAEDYDGVYFTVQALKLYCTVPFELIVVDNTPHSEHGKAVRTLIEQWSGKWPAKYIPMPEAVGTSQTRNRVFEEASCEYVACMDCHVLMQPGAIEALVDHFDLYPQTENLLTGPLLFDSLDNMATHFDMVWRREMWGIWGQAWTCKHCGEIFSIQADGNQDCTYHAMDSEHTKITRCEKCNNVFPRVRWSGHYQQMQQYGYGLAGNGSRPFEVPAQGLGFFASRRSSWLGFNKEFRGFGGEEGYIHEKYRQAGRTTLCLPQVKWNHRFGRPDGVKYPLNRLAKVRNYLIGFAELGLPIEQIHHEFVVQGSVPQATFDEMVKDPVGFEVNLVTGTMAHQLSGLPQPPAGFTLQQTYEWLLNVPRDLDRHMPMLKDLAANCDHVTEFTKRRESSVALLAGNPSKVVSYQQERDVLVTHTLHDILKRSPTQRKMAWTSHVGDTLEVEIIEPTDMLFVDSEHNGRRVYAELAKHGHMVNRYLVFHDVALYGAKGDDGKAGLISGIKKYVDENPEWFAMYLTPDQNGLLVLARNEEDRPPVHIWAWPPGYGPGTELKAMLKVIGIVATENCSCNARANLMDIRGHQWCRDNMDTILGWLQEEAHKRSLPFVKPGARLMVARAIKRSEKKEAAGEYPVSLSNVRPSETSA